MEWFKKHKIAVLGTLIIYVSIAIVFMVIKISDIRKNHKIEIEVEIPDKKEGKISDNNEANDIKTDLIKEELKSVVSNIDATQRINVDDMDEYERNFREEMGIAKKEAINYEKNKNYRKDSLDYEKTLSERKKDSIKSTIYVGKSRVTYMLKGRFSRFIPIPVFKCEFGGTVIVDIYVKSDGNVYKAEVVDEKSDTDECLRAAAIDSAMRSRFNSVKDESKYQLGQITYIFVKQ